MGWIQHHDTVSARWGDSLRCQVTLDISGSLASGNIQGSLTGMDNCLCLRGLDVLLQDCGTQLLMYWSNHCLALTHCNLVIPYVDVDVGPHWFR